MSQPSKAGEKKKKKKLDVICKTCSKETQYTDEIKHSHIMKRG